jgi:hypothetical protein
VHVNCQLIKAPHSAGWRGRFPHAYASAPVKAAILASATPLTMEVSHVKVCKFLHLNGVILTNCAQFQQKTGRFVRVSFWPPACNV